MVVQLFGLVVGARLGFGRLLVGTVIDFYGGVGLGWCWGGEGCSKALVV